MRRAARSAASYRASAERRCTRARGAVRRRQHKWGGVTAWGKPQIACNRCHTPRLSIPSTYPAHCKTPRLHGCAIGERARTVAAYREAVCGMRRAARSAASYRASAERRCTRARGAVRRRQHKWGGVTAWGKPQIACNRCHTPRLSIPSTYPAHCKTPRLCGCAIGNRARTFAAYREAVCGGRREAPPPIVHLRSADARVRAVRSGGVNVSGEA